MKCLLISSLPGKALRTLVVIARLAETYRILGECKMMPGKLDIKRDSPSILYSPASLAMSTSVLKR